MVRPREYLGSDGVSIKWNAVGATLFGAGVLAWFEGLAAVILTIVDVPIALAISTANSLADYIEVAFNPVYFSEAVAATLPFVESAGIAGYVVAIVIVLLIFAPIAWVVSRVV